ncbi:hypothetical protein [Halorussus pelagicus]|uniref:hypothetical protein n=1 Tax=Halorussus pelagicus TaxID=2505977 RepID=UPI000FFBB39C|nr:hypothetical protein [Halorussus pelagicus]
MKRRQFGAMLATATFSLGGVSSAAADASAQETDPLEIEDVSMELGEATVSVGRATFRYRDGAMRLQLDDWSVESDNASLSVGRKRVNVSDVTPETYAAVRAAMVETYEGQSLSPLLSALVESDLDPDSHLQVSLSSVESDGRLLADEVVATGTVGSVVPDGTRDFLSGGASLSALASLGAAEWSELRIERGDATLVADGVTMELDGTTFAIASPGGTAEVSGRSFEFSEMTLDILPPETLPAPHVEFASQVRQLGSEGSLTLSAVKSAAADSGVTVANTLDALGSARFELSLAEVTADGEAVVSDFRTSGTLADLSQMLRDQTSMDDDEEDDAEGGELPYEVIVSTTGTAGRMNYVIEVTGDLEKLEPDEDSGAAVDLVEEVDGRVRVNGTVGSGDDRFAFSGELMETDVPDGVQVEVIER